MPKSASQPPASVNMPKRCSICQTTLILYPRGFKDCPHCQKIVCRTCWRENWVEKRFPADQCGHRQEGETMSVAPVGEKVQSLQWDWQKTVAIGVLALLAIVVLIFLWNLFIF
ncbi:MAG: hypothetical protein ACREL1_01255 [bacterium]